MAKKKKDKSSPLAEAAAAIVAEDSSGADDRQRGLVGFRTYSPNGKPQSHPFIGDSLGDVPRFRGDIQNAQTWQIAQYSEGDQNQPYNWDPERSYGLQQALVAAGYMSKSSLSDTWRDTHSNALKRALEDANRYGISLDELLGGLFELGGSGGRGRGGGGGGGGGLAISDDDIKALANNVAQKVVGRNLRDEEIGNFIPAFRGALASGTSPQVIAENIVRNDTAPVEAYGHDIGNVLQTFNQMLGGRF